MRSAVEHARHGDAGTRAKRSCPPPPRPVWRWVLGGWVLAFAAGSGVAATTPEQRCERMAQNLAALEQRSTNPAQVARAQKQFERMCRAAPTGSTATPPTPTGNEPSTAQAPRANPSPPAPSAPFARAKTGGYFADWERELNAKCDSQTPDGRTRCAQMKIERAVQEGRLSAAEVEACLPSEPPAGRTRQRSEATHELQARRMGSLGGDAYWKWSTAGSCKLAERVQQTFAAIAPPAPRSTQTAATMCALDSDHPLCRAAAEPPRQRRFSMWSAAEYARCARESTPGQNRDPDYCARTVVAQAGQLGLLSATAVERCRAQWSRGPRERSEDLATYLCLEQGARLEELMTSRILRTQSAPVSGGSFPINGYRQPRAIAGIHAGRFSEVPPQSGDGPYFHHALAELGEACPRLGVLDVQMQLIQQMTRRQSEMLERAARGQASREEAQSAVASIAIGLAMMENCDGKDTHEERERCEQDKKELMTLPESRDAVHDVRLLVKRHACTSDDTRRFATNLGRWLMMPPAKRSPLAWAEGMPQKAQYLSMFDNCRRQAGDGAADAWCGCYVEQFSKTRPGTRAHPVEQAATAHHTAFVGESDAWFVPSGLQACDAHFEELKTWRRTQSPEKATACLLGQTPIADTIAPALQACRYRTAWGEIELRGKQCQPRLTARYWGGETVECQ